MISPSLLAAPQVAHWLDLSIDQVVTVRTGKVEIGQGILTAITQVVADTFSLPPDQIRVVSGITGMTPNEGYTAGSLSVPHSAVAVEAACRSCVAEYRRRIAANAGCAVGQVRFKAGVFSVDGQDTEATLWTLAADTGLAFEVSAEDAASAGQNTPTMQIQRIDLATKIAGSGMIQDIAVPDMLHAQVLRPPRLGAMPDLGKLSDADQAALVVTGGFVAVVGDNPIAVARQAEKLAARLIWTGGVVLSEESLSPASLRNLPAEMTEIGTDPGTATEGKRVSATYTRPYLMHGSIGCVTALAHWDAEAERLEVTSQTQGPYQLRDALAVFFELDPEQVVVTHAAGAGCYGHNGADDVAADAAIVARAHPGNTVRVSWTRAEELASAPLAPAAEVDISATLDEAGKPTSLTLDIWSATHARRPGTAPDGTLLAELHATGRSTLPQPIELPPMHGFGGLRNGMPPYAVPVRQARLNLVDPPGLRTSAMRGLGTHVNVFAIESFMDELAAQADEDPLAYRLSLLEDDRAKAVLIHVAEIADWAERPEAGTGEGWGIAYSRYKDRAAYVATVAKVHVAEDVQLSDIWCVADAGRVINTDGLRNQIEGGIVQSASWALFEEVRLNADGALPSIWEDYPILRFGDLPQIRLDILDSPDPEPLGAGEVAVGPVTAAIANAVSHGLGTRLRRLPLSRDRVMEALLQT